MKQPSAKRMIPSKASLRNNYRGANTTLTGAQNIYNRGQKIPQHQGSKSISGPQDH